MTNTHVGAHPLIPRFIRLFSVPILLGWLALTVLVNVMSPQLEVVGEAHAVSLAPNDAPSMQAMQRVGKTFQEFDSNSSVMVVLEGDQPLGDDAHKYYDGLIDKLEADKQHVEHIQDFWGDPLTAAGSQSADGKAAYVQLYLRGNQGESIANESVAAVRDIVANSTPPTGIKAYVTGPAALTSDQHSAGDKSVQLITMITIAVIFVMLLFVYRSIMTVAARARDDVHGAGGRPRNRRHPRLLRAHRAVDVRRQPAHHAGDRRGHGLRDLPRRPVPRGAAERRGPRNRLLHHVSRHGARDPRLRPDHRGCHLLSALHPTAVLPDPRHTAGRRACLWRPSPR